MIKSKTKPKKVVIQDKIPIIKSNTNYSQVRIVDEDKNNIGIFDIKSALKLASDQDKQLVQVSFNEIPICIVCDYNEYIYKINKTTKKQSNKSIVTKEIQINTKIDLQDIIRKLDKIIDTIEEDSKITLIIRKNYKDTLDTMNFIQNFFIGKNVDVKNITSSKDRRNTKLQISKKK